MTNYSLNKKNDKPIDENELKWPFKDLTKALEEVGVNMDILWSNIYDVIIKSIISVDHLIFSQTQKIGSWNNNCFELFGFDILIDQDLNPYVLEVNLSPSLSADSKLDFNIKSNLILDALNLVGIRYNLISQKDKSPIKHKKLLPLE